MYYTISGYPKDVTTGGFVSIQDKINFMYVSANTNKFYYFDVSEYCDQASLNQRTIFTLNKKHGICGNVPVGLNMNDKTFLYYICTRAQENDGDMSFYYYLSKPRKSSGISCVSRPTHKYQVPSNAQGFWDGGRVSTHSKTYSYQYDSSTMYLFGAHQVLEYKLTSSGTDIYKASSSVYHSRDLISGAPYPFYTQDDINKGRKSLVKMI